MTTVIKTLGAFLARRPAQLGAAVSAWVAVANPSPAAMAAVVATVGWVVSSYTSPKVAVEEAHAAGYDKAVAEVSALSVQ